MKTIISKPYVLELVDRSGDVIETHYFNSRRELDLFTRLKGYR